MFLKKSKTVQERMAAIDGRIAELNEKKKTKWADLEERKYHVSQLLGELAEKDNPQTEENLKTAKKSVERLEEVHADLSTQLSLLEKNKTVLQKEYAEARLRETVDLGKEQAQAWHDLLRKALGATNVLKDIYDQMKNAEAEFTKLSAEHRDCEEKLGQFGGWSPSPAIPYILPEFYHFIGSITAYDQQLRERAEFLKANPNLEAQEKQIEEHFKQRDEFHSWINPLRYH